MGRRRWGGVFLGLTLWLTAVACSPIHEPWVQEDSPLRKERLRPPEQQAELRHRLAYTQIDR